MKNRMGEKFHSVLLFCFWCCLIVCLCSVVVGRNNVDEMRDELLCVNTNDDKYHVLYHQSLTSNSSL